MTRQDSKIGDVVVITNKRDDFLMSNVPVGYKGVVVCLHSHDCGVDFGVETIALKNGYVEPLHNCGGVLPRGTGNFVAYQCIRKVEKKSPLVDAEYERLLV